MILGDATSINGNRYGLVRCPSCNFEWASWLPEPQDPWLACTWDEHDTDDTTPPELVCVLVPFE